MSESDKDEALRQILCEMIQQKYFDTSLSFNLKFSHKLLVLLKLEVARSKLQLLVPVLEKQSGDEGGKCSSEVVFMLHTQPPGFDSHHFQKLFI